MATKRVKRPSVVEGVQMSKLDKKVFEAAWKKALEDCAAMDNPPVDLSKSPKVIFERVKHLVLWYRATTPNNELGGCTECGGDSDVRLECCPFCGDGELVDEEGNIVEEEDSEPPEVPEDEAPAEEAPEVEVLPPDEPKTKAEAPLAKNDEPPTDLTPTHLANSVMKIEKLKAEAANSLWELGREVRFIVDNNLWMLCETDDGKRKYRTFKQFVVGELGMSYTHAHRLMQVSQAFSEEEMKQVGVTKCQLILQVPKEKRAGLLETAKNENTSRAQLSDAVKNLTEGEKPQPPKKNERRLTAVMAPGRTELKLYARPKGREGYPSAEEAKANMKQAKAVGDDPFAMEVLPNDVRVLYHLARDTDGSLLLIVERKRAKEDEVFAAAEMNGED